MKHLWQPWPLLGVLAGSIFFGGCESGQDAATTQAPPFVFKSLELRQKRPKGEKDWDLISPEARYEFSRRLVRASRPEGILYRNNQPSFRVRADRATVINDGQLVLLEGSVQLQQLQGQKVLIKGDRLRWTPAQELLVMEQRPEAIDRLTRIKSTKARLHQRSHDLTLLGTVQLERWSPKQLQKVRGHAYSVVRARRTLWNLDHGGLMSEGPVLGQRRGDGHKTLQQLQAKELKGNTKQGFIDLIGPVRVLAPDRKGELNAATTRWLIKEDALVSERPFNAGLQKSTLRGDGFRVAMGKTTLTVLRGCELTQPGDRLTAKSCQWNWTSNRVSAHGQVELRRKANQQVTRSERLDGNVGKKGLVVFSSPSGSVKSQLNIKDDQTRPPAQRKRRASPVSF